MAAEAREARAVEEAQRERGRERRWVEGVVGELKIELEGIQEGARLSAETATSRDSELRSVKTDLERLSATAASLHSAAGARIVAGEEGKRLAFTDGLYTKGHETRAHTQQELIRGGA